MLELLIKVVLAFAFGAVVGYIYKVFYRPRFLQDRKNLVESKFTEVDGFDVHYLQRGHGPDLLLIHGIGASSYCWRHIWRDLAKDYRVTVVDLPGFGQSSKHPDASYDLDTQTRRLAAFLDAVGIRKTHILGCSMGGALGLWLGLSYPEKVDRVATISPAVNHRLVFLNPDRWRWLMNSVRGFVVTPFLVRQIARRVHSRYDKLTENDFQQFYRPYHRNPDAVTAFWKSQDLLRDPRLPDGLSALRKPVLILYGEGDRIVPSKYVYNLDRILTNAKIVKHPSGGHHLMEDEPRFVVEEVKKFLSEKHLSVV